MAVLAMTLAVAGILGGRALAGPGMPRAACRFVHYYEAAGRGDVEVSWWERIAYSWMLSQSGPGTHQETAGAAPRT
jgi:hypothetical protein